MPWPLSFALNALTGRKLVTLKRGHTELFTNATKNMEDAAIILYSNRTQEIERVLKERNVKYLYWDYYWIQSEYIFDQQGKLTGMFDPLVLFDNPDTESFLRYNNISFQPYHTWLDPAIRREDIPQYDLLFVLPYEFNLTHPWRPDLDNYLQEMWRYTDPSSNTVVARIYKIVNL